LRGVGVQICLLFVRSSFFLGFVHTLQSPLSLLITSETCCETRKLLLCFAFFLSLFRRVEVAVVDLFHLLLFRRCFCHLNAWIFEYLAEGFVLFLGRKSGFTFATRSSRGSQTHEKK
jgi:hypothetical protein